MGRGVYFETGKGYLFKQEDLYYCDGCSGAKSPFDVVEEVESRYCPVCLENSTAPDFQNDNSLLCKKCMECPHCHIPLTFLLHNTSWFCSVCKFQQAEEPSTSPPSTSQETKTFQNYIKLYQISHLMKKKYNNFLGILPSDNFSSPMDPSGTGGPCLDLKSGMPYVFHKGREMESYDSGLGIGDSDKVHLLQAEDTEVALKRQAELYQKLRTNHPSLWKKKGVQQKLTLGEERRGEIGEEGKREISSPFALQNVSVGKLFNEVRGVCEKSEEKEKRGEKVELRGVKLRSKKSRRCGDCSRLIIRSQLHPLASPAFSSKFNLLLNSFSRFLLMKNIEGEDREGDSLKNFFYLVVWNPLETAISIDIDLRPSRADSGERRDIYVYEDNKFEKLMEERRGEFLQCPEKLRIDFDEKGVSFSPEEGGVVLRQANDRVSLRLPYHSELETAFFEITVRLSFLRNESPVSLETRLFLLI